MAPAVYHCAASLTDWTFLSRLFCQPGIQIDFPVYCLPHGKLLEKASTSIFTLDGLIDGVEKKIAHGLITKDIFGQVFLRITVLMVTGASQVMCFFRCSGSPMKTFKLLAVG